jgi:dienelactone hydrolase
VKHKFLMPAAAVAIVAGAGGFVSAAQTPPISGGGYTNVIQSPVVDSVKAVAGALFKPEGAGPFPAVIYLGSCAPVGSPQDADLENTFDHYRAKGFATLIVDSYTARHRDHGVCDRVHNPVWYGLRAADAQAAKNVLAAMADIDAERIFFVGYNHGGQAALLAAEASTAAAHEAKFAGVVAYYPYCGFVCGCAFSVPTLIMVGDQDDLAPAGRCQAVKNKPNAEVVVYSGAAHGFAAPGIDKVQDGHRLAYNAKAAEDAEARADAFMAAHMK